MRTLTVRRLFYGTVRRSFILLMLVFVFVPLLWMISTSLKVRAEIATDIPTFVPTEPTLDNYRVVLGIDEASFSQRARVTLVNSIIVGSASTVGVVVLGVPAAYALARSRRRAAEILQQQFLISRLIPPAVIVIPLFLQFTHLGLMDMRASLTLIYIATLIPLGVLILLAFIIDLPRDIEEAAVVDGASQLQLLRYIVTPLLSPALVACAMITFIFAWNEFFFALVFTRNRAQTFPVLVNSLIGTVGVQWGPITAAGVLGIIPPLVALVVTYRYLVQGLTMGSVK